MSSKRVCVSVSFRGARGQHEWSSVDVTRSMRDWSPRGLTPATYLRLR